MIAKTRMDHPLPLTRRQALGLLASVSALPAIGAIGGASAAPSIDMQIIILADMHSAYERMAELLAAIDMSIAAAPTPPRLIVINGDVFERGNVVALRSQGSLDWAFVEALVRRAPVVLNIGNHEADLTLDLALTVAQARRLGVTVLSNIIDARMGAPYAEAHASVRLGSHEVSIVGLAVDDLSTYPKDVRSALTIPAAADWAAKQLPGLLGDTAFNLVLSHAGVGPDKQILPLLPDGTLIIGGHDHLLFRHEAKRTRYVHTGSWNRGFGIANIGRDGNGRTITLSQVQIAQNGPKDKEFAALIEAALKEHLTDQERDVIGRSPAPLSLDETGREVSRIIARAHGGAVGLIGHTTLGTGLPGGEVTRYAFDAVIRFEGELMSAEVDADTLNAIFMVANQDRDMPLEARMGDYVYANPVEVVAGQIYRLVTNDWTARNQKGYLGRTDIAFEPIAGAKLKPTVVAALQG